MKRISKLLKINKIEEEEETKKLLKNEEFKNKKLFFNSNLIIKEKMDLMEVYIYILN